MIQFRNKSLKFLNNILYDLPTSPNLNYFYNYGSILRGCLLIQLFSGIFLATHYIPHVLYRFDTISHIVRDLRIG